MKTWQPLSLSRRVPMRAGIGTGEHEPGGWRGPCCCGPPGRSVVLGEAAAGKLGVRPARESRASGLTHRGLAPREVADITDWFLFSRLLWWPRSWNIFLMIIFLPVT